MFKFVPELQLMYEKMYKILKTDSANQTHSNSKLICKLDFAIIFVYNYSFFYFDFKQVYKFESEAIMHLMT